MVKWKDGKRNGISKSYGENGKPLTDETFEDGKLIKTASFDSNGNLRAVKEGTFRGHMIVNGTITKYTPSGSTVVEKYSNGKLINKFE